MRIRFILFLVLLNFDFAFGARTCPSVFKRAESSYFVQNYKKVNGEFQRGTPTCWLHATVKMLEAYSLQRTGHYRQISVEHLYLTNLVDRLEKENLTSRKDLFTTGTILTALQSVKRHGVSLKSEFYEPGAFFNPDRFTERVWDRIANLESVKTSKTSSSWASPFLFSPFVGIDRRRPHQRNEFDLYRATELIGPNDEFLSTKTASLNTADSLFGEYEIKVVVVGKDPGPDQRNRLSMDLPVEFEFVPDAQQALWRLREMLQLNQMPALVFGQGRGTHAVTAFAHDSDPGSGQVVSLTVLDSDDQRENWHGKKYRKMTQDELSRLVYFVTLENIEARFPYPSPQR